MKLDLKDLSSKILSTVTAEQIEATFQRLVTGGQSTPTGVLYVFDLIQQCNIYSSRSVAKMLGYPFDWCNNPKAVGTAHLIHPDHLEAVANHYQRFGTLRGEAVITLDYQMLRPDGQWCWLRSQETTLVASAQGFPLQVMGLVHLLEPCQPSPQNDDPVERVRQLINQTFQPAYPFPRVGVEFVS